MLIEIKQHFNISLQQLMKERGYMEYNCVTPQPIDNKVKSVIYAVYIPILPTLPAHKYSGKTIFAVNKLQFSKWIKEPYVFVDEIFLPEHDTRESMLAHIAAGVGIKTPKVLEYAGSKLSRSA